MAQTHPPSDQHAAAAHEPAKATPAAAAPKEPTDAEVLAGIEHLRTAGGPVGMLADAMVRLLGK